jgi:hypothetical protein
VANAAGSGRSKQWVIDQLTEAGATIVSDDEIDLTAEHIVTVENLIEPPAEAEAVNYEDLEIQYKALEARAELAGLSAEALSDNHGAINPDYELTPFVIAELGRQVDAWVNAFGPGDNATLELAAIVEGEVIEAEVNEVPKLPDAEIVAAPLAISAGQTDPVVTDTCEPPIGTITETIKKKSGRKSKASAVKRIEKIIAELKALYDELNDAEGGEHVSD